MAESGAREDNWMRGVVHYPNAEGCYDGSVQVLVRTLKKGDIIEICPAALSKERKGLGLLKYGVVFTLFHYEDSLLVHFVEVKERQETLGTGSILTTIMMAPFHKDDEVRLVGQVEVPQVLTTFKLSWKNKLSCALSEVRNGDYFVDNGNLYFRIRELSPGSIGLPPHADGPVILTGVHLKDGKIFLSQRDILTRVLPVGRNFTFKKNRNGEFRYEAHYTAPNT